MLVSSFVLRGQRPVCKMNGLNARSAFLTMGNDPFIDGLFELGRVWGFPRGCTCEYRNCDCDYDCEASDGERSVGGGGLSGDFHETRS